MLPSDVLDAFSTLSTCLSSRPDLTEKVASCWPAAGRVGPPDAARSDLPTEVRAAADVLARELPKRTRSAGDVAALAALFAEPAGDVLFIWCGASTWRTDAHIVRLLTEAARY